MKLSHSKLTTILSCPMTYYLNYKQKIQLKIRPSALAVGSAVHWGIEHNTEDLSDYYNEEGSFKQQNNYSRDQILAEAMAHGYLKHKDELFDQILTDPQTGEKLDLLDESHEVYMTAKLKTFLQDHEDHDFEGIIDLLLLTNKGFIIIDYKTSSGSPDWDKYLDQIYRYIFLLRDSFPDVPVVKIGIVNLIKTQIRQKKTENELQFLQRMKMEYDINDENLINYHEYLPEQLDSHLVSAYLHNLSKMADMAQIIEDNHQWYINFANANGVYGKSQYWDIFYETPGAEVLYNICDHIWDEDENQFVERRDCRAIDMKVIDNNNVLNKYSKWKDEFVDFTNRANTKDFRKYLKNNFIVDESLLNLYEKTFYKEKEINK